MLIQSFSPDSLRKIQTLEPSLSLILLYKEEEEDSETIREDLARSLKVHPYTVNEEQEMEDLISLGMDGKFTNLPDSWPS